MDNNSDESEISGVIFSHHAVVVVVVDEANVKFELALELFALLLFDMLLELLFKEDLDFITHLLIPS